MLSYLLIFHLISILTYSKQLITILYTKKNFLIYPNYLAVLQLLYLQCSVIFKQTFQMQKRCFLQQKEIQLFLIQKSKFKEQKQIFTCYYQFEMAHRLTHLNKKANLYPQENQTPQYVQQNEPSNAPTGMANKINQAKGDKLPRPIFAPSNQYINYEKNGFRKGLATFPSPQQLFVSENNYDAGPQFIRPTSVIINNMPKKSIFPLGAWITPMGSQLVHAIDVHSPLRCHRCKAYVNPYFQFDGSRKVATCNICGMKFQIDEAIDRKNLQSTEIATKGVIDFVVKDKFYHLKRTDIIKIVVCIEISQTTIQLGIFNTVIESLKSAVENSQFEDKLKISIVYFSEQGIIFPKLRKGDKWNQSQITEYVVKVTENSTFCCPLSDEQMMLDLNKQKDKIIYLLDQISAKAEAYYQKGRYTATANYVAALKCLKESFETETGRIMLFSCLDPRTGKCSIRPRNEQQGKFPLKPLHNQFYQLSKQLLKTRIGVEHFMFTKDNMISHQLATVHFISSQTGGPLHFYPGYQYENNSEHLYYTIYKSLTKSFAYDINYTCRVSNGMNIMSFYTPSGSKQVRDVSMGCMDPSHSVAVLFEHEQKIEQSYGAFIQFAMMYTTGSGQRRIRVINFRYLISQKLQNLYQSVDGLAVANILSRIYTTKLFNNDPQKVREEFLNKLASIIAQFRFKCNSTQAKYSELNAPQNMRNGLAYIHSIANHKLFMNPLKLTSDYRVAQILKINSADFYTFAMKYYPRLYPLTMDIYNSEPLPGDFVQTGQENQDQTQQQIAVLPQNLPLTRSQIKDTGVYINDDGQYLIIVVMNNADEQLLTQIFGTTDYEQIQTQGLPQLQGSHSIRINIIINQLRRRNSANNGIYLPLLIRTPMKKGPFGELVNNLAKEDYHQCNYYTFLDQVHRLTQSMNK